MLKIEEHEQKINELSEFLKVEGVDSAKASLLIQSLRDNYTEVNTTLTTNTQKIDEINGLNEGLRSANMQLLSKLGTQIDVQASHKSQEKPKEQPKEETPLSLEDVSKEFLK